MAKPANKPLSRRQALGPLAGLALAATPWIAASAEQAQPGARPRPPDPHLPRRKARLDAAMRYLNLAKAQLPGAYPNSPPPNRLATAIDAAINETRYAYSILGSARERQR